jgi:hypothetical protein
MRRRARGPRWRRPVPRRAGAAGLGKAVVAVDPRHFLDQVDLEAMSKRCDGGVASQPASVRVKLHAEALKNPLHLGIGISWPSSAASRARRSARPARRQVRLRGPLDHRSGLPARDIQQQRVARSMARRWWAGSTPRSKRCEASVCRPSRRARPAIASGAKNATSKNTSRVAADTPESSPPMIPATARGPPWSAITSVSGSSATSRPSSSDDLFARLRQPHDDALAQGGEVEAVHRLAELEHHDVGDVHHRVDGAQAGAAQLLPHPQRRDGVRADAANDAPDEARAGLRGAHLDREFVVITGARPGEARPAQRQAVDQRDLARNAQHAEAVAAVRRQVDVDDLVVQPEPRAQVDADRRIRRQVPQALVAVAEPELAIEHSMPLLSTPRSFARLIFSPPGSSPPTSATGAFMPARTFGAPQTMSSFSLRAGIDRQTVSLSASGWRSTDSTGRPPPRKRRRGRRRAVHLQPRHGQLADDVAVSTGGSTHSRSQRSLNFIAPLPG